MIVLILKMLEFDVLCQVIFNIINTSIYSMTLRFEGFYKREYIKTCEVEHKKSVEINETLAEFFSISFFQCL